jgi:hypothetical protein
MGLEAKIEIGATTDSAGGVGTSNVVDNLKWRSAFC